MNTAHQPVYIQQCDAETPIEEMLFMMPRCEVLEFVKPVHVVPASIKTLTDKLKAEEQRIAAERMKGHAERIKRISSDSYEFEDLQEKAEVRTLRAEPRHMRGVKPGVPRVASRAY